MKHLVFSGFITALLLCMTAFPSFASSEHFTSSAPALRDVFGVPTSDDTPVPQNSELANQRRNKDAAVAPPPYGFFGGRIDTDYLSPYHGNEATGGSGSGAGSSASENTGSWRPLEPGSQDILQGQTAPKYYSNGTIGTLSIPAVRLNNIKVFQGTDSATMMNGWGHYESTSAWAGNVVLAGHNRGANVNVDAIKNLEYGDTITYTTPYGTRTYQVFSVSKISSTDGTPLAPSGRDNTITLITCVSNDPSRRWCVQGREI